MGCDHKAEMIVGVQTHENGEDSVVKIHVRRAENAVFYEHDSKVFVKQFKSDSDMLDMGDAVQFSSCSGALRIVSTATFGAKFWMPELLREWEMTDCRPDGTPGSKDEGKEAQNDKIMLH